MTRHTKTNAKPAQPQNDCRSALEASGVSILEPTSHILVPLALCEDTERAIRCATRLTVQHGATMSLVYGHESEDDLRREAADLIIISVINQATQPVVEQAILCAPCPVLVVYKSGARLFWQGPVKPKRPSRRSAPPERTVAAGGQSPERRQVDGPASEPTP